MNDKTLFERMSVLSREAGLTAGELRRGPNRSNAVMNKRIEPMDSPDDFPTPPWAVRALLNKLSSLGEPIDYLDALEPACGRGFMWAVLKERFQTVQASDLIDYGAGFPIEDYLEGGVKRSDWVITNPPFKLAEKFIKKALAEARHGVAMLVRTNFLEGSTRYQRLFLRQPPTDVIQFTERVVMLKGRLVQANAKYINDDGKEVTSSTATSYCWLVWRKGSIEGMVDPAFHWSGIVRKSLEKSGDYPENPDGLSQIVKSLLDKK